MTTKYISNDFLQSRLPNLPKLALIIFMTDKTIAYLLRR
ncbi:hypothetical protein BTN49_1014 [Candidatus Enterovibrio escicola]|uniref:Uncharacterized protein n=1 Tax=Candidatus Enterovibrio escicola TaxID=1927127 RepID=A0A2A5T4E7_9GAMM|nr:hypothetical protein BTN49_1014 [Candidatus Enterovibrio escacola]